MDRDTPITMTPRQLSELLRSMAAEVVVGVLAGLKSEPVLLDAVELSNRLGISITTLQRWSRAGKIPVVKMGTKNKYKLLDVLAAIEEFEPVNEEEITSA